MKSYKISRRELLKVLCGSTMLPLLSSMGGCAGSIRQNPNTNYLNVPFSPANGNVILGMHKDGNMNEACESILADKLNCDWLSHGDSVLVKITSNSPNEHPAVTSPNAIKAIVKSLKDLGAGKIYVAEQSGVEYVRLTKTFRKSSTKEVLQKNGLLNAIKESGAIPYFFDDQGFDKGYFKPELDFPNHWENSMYIPNIVREVDHIVYLPRLGAHALTGYTCAIKTCVGWLRDDSRLKMHQQGSNFFEKIAEVDHVKEIRERLRLALFLCDKVLLNIGPDIGGEYEIDGCISVASKSLVDCDALCSVLIPWFDKQDNSFYDIYSPYPHDIDFFNKHFVSDSWDEEGLKNYEPLIPNVLNNKIEYDICISHLAQLQKYRPQKIDLQTIGDGIPLELETYLNKINNGIFNII